MHEIELITEGTKTKILLDGKEIQATRAFFDYHIGCVPTAVLEIPLKKATVKADQAHVLNQNGEEIIL